MKLAEAIAFAEETLGRGLGEDEIVLVGRMVEAGSDAADILNMLDRPVETPPDEEGVKTFRYEARGDKVARIPDAVPEDVQQS